MVLIKAKYFSGKSMKKDTFVISLFTNKFVLGNKLQSDFLS